MTNYIWKSYNIIQSSFVYFVDYTTTNQNVYRKYIINELLQYVLIMIYGNYASYSALNSVDRIISCSD